MQLLILILKKLEIVDQLMRSLAAAGVKGGTILNGIGMGEALVNMDSDELPIFGILRRVLADEERADCKVMMFVLKDEEITAVRTIIRDTIGDLGEPNTGIMFSVPITYVEGLGE